MQLACLLEKNAASDVHKGWGGKKRKNKTTSGCGCQREKRDEKEQQRRKRLETNYLVTVGFPRGVLKRRHGRPGVCSACAQSLCLCMRARVEARNTRLKAAV